MLRRYLCRILYSRSGRLLRPNRAHVSTCRGFARPGESLDQKPRAGRAIVRGRAYRLLLSFLPFPVGCYATDDADAGRLVEVWSVPVDSIVSVNRVQLVANRSCGIWLLDPDGAQINRWTCDGRSLAPLPGTDGERRRFREPSLFGALIDRVRGPLDLRTVKTVFGAGSVRGDTRGSRELRSWRSRSRHPSTI